MSIVTRVLYKQKLKSTKGKDYVLTTLLLDDGTEVDTIKDFGVGDRVRVIWSKLSDEWDRPYVVLIRRANDEGK